VYVYVLFRGHEDEIWGIMVRWWISSQLELLSETIVNFYATDHATYASFPERCAIVLLAIERCATVFILNCPSSSFRITLNTISSICMLIGSLAIRSSKFESDLAKSVILVGRCLVFAGCIASSGAVIFNDKIERFVESKTGIAHAKSDEDLVRYAYFQMGIVIVVFTLQMTSACLMKDKKTETETVIQEAVEVDKQE
jgi:hypothetical protein